MDLKFADDLNGMHNTRNHVIDVGPYAEEHVMADDRKVKVVTKVPSPPEVTTEMLEKAAEEARDWREAYAAQTLSMETVTSDELKVRAK